MVVFSTSLLASRHDMVHHDVTAFTLTSYQRITHVVVFYILFDDSN